MKNKKLIVVFSLLTSLGYGQLSQYESYLSPYLSAPVRSGFFIFHTPNNFTPGSLFMLYKAIAPDANNSMQLIGVHTDNLAHLTHYKYQQTYKGVPVEGTGCIEHVDNHGNMVFINAKLTNLNLGHIPELEPEDAVSGLLKHLGKRSYAWLNSDWEQQIRLDRADSAATWYPAAELLFAIDTLNDMQYLIDSTRYRLAYKIRVVTLESIKDYLVDANTNAVFRVDDALINDGPADVYGYGSRIIDTRWEGGFTQKWTLHANDANRRIHTKKWTGQVWNLTPNIKDADDNWGNTYLTETTAHYFTMTAWDYYKNYFGRTGMNNDAIEVRVYTQLSMQNATFSPVIVAPELKFGKTSLNFDYGMDASVVGHEFTHGVNNYTANLHGYFETGALSESYSDIFGITIQAKMLNGGATDWIMSNDIPNDIQNTRSLSNPKSLGTHFTGSFDVNGNPVYGLGQPDTYGATYFYSGGDNVDFGGVHINCSVQNYWYYLLCNGGSGTNDLNNAYAVNGVGMTRASQIAYYALTSMLMGSSQYSDSREATVEAAKILFGECSPEHQNTMQAWYAVGIGPQNDCTYTLATNEITTAGDISVFPNPASAQLTIEVPFNTSKEIKIFDASGKLVETMRNDLLVTHCDISAFDRGIYTVWLNANGTVITKKFIVQ